MNRTIRLRWILATVLVLGSRSVAADVAVDVHVGTLGVGAGVTVGVNEQLNLRGIGNWFSYQHDDEASDVDYEFDLNLLSFGGVFDWHPGGAQFRLSAGAFINNNDVVGDGVLNDATVEIGDMVFDTDLVGTLEADLSFRRVAPYVGIGWGNAVAPNGRWRFSLDLGVLLQGEPQVDFRSVGADPSIRDSLEAEITLEEANIQNDISQYNLYPVVAIGVSYRLGAR